MGGWGGVWLCHARHHSYQHDVRLLKFTTPERAAPSVPCKKCTERSALFNPASGTGST